MKKILALLLLAVMCLSLAACGAKDSAVAPITLDGKETSVNDFLIEHLNEYIKREDFIAREEAYKDLFGGAQPREPELQMAVEVNLNGVGSSKMNFHFLMVKLACDFAVDDGGYDAAILLVDYDTGKVYDQFDLDESWQGQESTEGYVYTGLYSCFRDGDYNGQAIFSDDTEVETRTMLSQKDIDTINASLNK